MYRCTHRNCKPAQAFEDRCEILWDPEEAKRKAKEEDEQKSKEALAEKFKHVKDDPDKPQIDL